MLFQERYRAKENSWGVKNVRLKHADILQKNKRWWRQCETLMFHRKESMSAVLCHHEETFSENKSSLLCPVSDFLCDPVSGCASCWFWPPGSQLHQRGSCIESHALLSSQFCQHGWINCSELPCDLHPITVISGWRLLSALWPVTRPASQRTEYGIFPGGFPFFTINIPKAKTLIWERWWEFFLCCMACQWENVVFSLDLISDPESKSALCQSGGRGPLGPRGHNLEEFLISGLWEPNDVVGMWCFCPSLKP